MHWFTSLLGNKSNLLFTIGRQIFRIQITVREIFFIFIGFLYFMTDFGLKRSFCHQNETLKLSLCVSYGITLICKTFQYHWQHLRGASTFFFVHKNTLSVWEKCVNFKWEYENEYKFGCTWDVIQFVCISHVCIMWVTLYIPNDQIV